MGAELFCFIRTFLEARGFQKGEAGHFPMQEDLMQSLSQYPQIVEAVQSYLSRGDELTDLCIQVQQIPAPTGAEGERAAWVAGVFEALDLQNVAQDELFNVYARVPGRDSSLPALMVSAHTDTVFPAETDLTVRVDEQTGRIYGPGLGDNSTGVASLIALAQQLVALEPPVDVWLVANSGEEGLGDLRGMRGAVNRLQDRIGACVVLEGMGLGRIVHRGLGSRRYRIIAHAPGGHSWSDFGTASAIHVLVQIANEIAHLRPPAQPRTTFNIGRIQGGTSINTIAQQASLELDLRSEDAGALAQIDRQVQKIVGRYQTARWRQWGVRIETEVIGDRPSGEIGRDHPLVVAAQQALVGAGLTGRFDLRISSTDANIPLSRGIPAVCVGITQGGNAHRLEEWINPAYLPQGMQHLLLLTWWAAMWLGGEAGS